MAGRTVRCIVRKKIITSLFVALALAWAFQPARAGAIRYAGKKITQGTTAIAGATADGVQAAGGGMAAAGKASGGAVKTGAVTAGKGAKATPGLIARGGKSIAKAIW